MADKKLTEGAKQQKRVSLAFAQIDNHPIFAAISSSYSYWMRGVQYAESRNTGPYPTAQLLSVDCNGTVCARPSSKWTEGQWQYAYAISLLHLGLGHSLSKGAWTIYRHAAAHIEAHRFLTGLKLIPADDLPPHTFEGVPTSTMSELELWLLQAVELTKLAQWLPYGDTSFFVPSDIAPLSERPIPDFVHAFGLGIRNAIELAIDVAAGKRLSLTDRTNEQTIKTQGQTARAWLLAHYPLLSGIAAYFKLIESIEACRAHDVRVAMINVQTREVFLNPLAGLSAEEWLFVLAHEYLHAGLNHHGRMDGRDPEIWNVACDFAINDWLVDLKIGVKPAIGAMYDSQFHGWSAERIYDHLVRNIRLLRKWETLAGFERRDFVGAQSSFDTDAERYCRQALFQGYFRHQSQGRGTLPAELSESIRALEQPIIPWDVQLGRWFDLHIPFPERRRSYLRLSRRQQAIPDTPIPRTTVATEYKSNAHTFGVILDSSGSMSRSLLAKAIGTIAQYALAHEVPALRLIFCDAQPYDAGYISPDDLLYQPIAVQGRGGTVLASAVAYIDKLDDFPDDAPLLILTDGATDTFDVKRIHAFVLPKGNRLPFAARGDVFYVS